MMTPAENLSNAIFIEIFVKYSATLKHRMVQQYPAIYELIPAKDDKQDTRPACNSILMIDYSE
jgi:hypothetical protein